MVRGEFSVEIALIRPGSINSAIVFMVHILQELSAKN